MCAICSVPYVTPVCNRSIRYLYNRPCGQGYPNTVGSDESEKGVNIKTILTSFRCAQVRGSFRFQFQEKDNKFNFKP